MKRYKTKLLTLLILLLMLPSNSQWAYGFTGGPLTESSAKPLFKVKQVTEVAPAFAGNPVGLSWLTYGGYQYVAFYDPDRQLTVGKRDLTSTAWQFHKLDEYVALDAHNYVTLTVDSEGYLHMSGNMHVDPLKYWRTAIPGDIDSFVRISSMVGTEESSVTYPLFMKLPDGRLLFSYRNGSSGNGNQLINVYNTASRTWSRFLAAPMFDGESLRSAYTSATKLGPDGKFHMGWVWRDTPGAETNSRLSYAQSPDLQNWTASSGQPVQLPITYARGEVVDPVQPKSGMLNNVKLGFDSAGRPVLTYIKFDREGDTQIYSSRRNAAGWQSYQMTDWTGRWDFNGGGSLPNLISMGSVEYMGPELGLWMKFSHTGQPGGGRQQAYLLDEATLQPKAQPVLIYPDEVGKVQSAIPGMKVNLLEDYSQLQSSGKVFLLRWETLDAARDIVKLEDLPRDQKLQLIELEKNYSELKLPVNGAPACQEASGPYICPAPYAPGKSRTASANAFFQSLNYDQSLELKQIEPWVQNGQYTEAAHQLRNVMKNRTQPAYRVNPMSHPSPPALPVKDAAGEDMLKHRFAWSGLTRTASYDIRTWWPYPKEMAVCWNADLQFDTCNPIGYDELERISPIAGWYNRLNAWTHLGTLGKAYFTTRNPEYARQWAHDMMDWIYDNPVPAKLQDQGPWSVSAAGIRLSGPLIDHIHQFLDAPEVNDEEFSALLQALSQTADLLTGYEPGPLDGGVVIGRVAAALQAAGTLFPEFAHASAWKQRADNLYLLSFSAPRVGAYASQSHGTFPVSRLIDGNVNTFWSTPTSKTNVTQWVYLDLGQKLQVGQVRLAPRQEAGYGFPVDFMLEYSGDAVNWAQVPGQSYSGYPNPGKQLQTFTFTEPVPARYIRLTVTKLGKDNNLDYVLQLGEFWADYKLTPAGNEEPPADTVPPKLTEVTRVSDTRLIVTLSESSVNLNQPHDGGFTVSETGNTSVQYPVTSVAQGEDNRHVVLTVADMGESALTGVTVTYTAGGHGLITDLAENPLATDTVGVTVPAWETPGQLHQAPRIGAGASQSHPLFPVERLIDGNLQTFWSTPTSLTSVTRSVYLDMGQILPVKQVRLAPRADRGYGFPVDFQIEASTDALNWTVVPGQSYTGYPNPGPAVQTFSFAEPVSARYIRIYATGLGIDNNRDYVFQLGELWADYIRSP
ncbi:BNR-4 repeat-containing protein [Paenibacillus filicis]|uniref:BNR-4 repeat-containing protein n=1 Tax=Paenibacillus filicis TaxID=669464 RepID=A0ABU9DSM2_9BACL